MTGAGLGRDRLQALAAKLPGSMLLLHDEQMAPEAEALALTRDDVVRSPGLAGLPPAPRPWDGVLVAVSDAASLRRLASVLPRVGPTPVVACWLDEAEQPLLPAPDARWSVAALSACRERGGATTILRLARRAPTHQLLAGLARVSVPGGPQGSSGVVVATAEPSVGWPPPADVVQVLGDAPRRGEPDDHWPPDVVLGHADSAWLPGAPVTGREPLFVNEPELLVGPLDEGVLNPTGYREEALGPVIELTSEGPVLVRRHSEARLRLSGPGLALPLRSRRGLTAAAVRALRGHRAVRVRWPRRPDPALDRVVAGLALAGVPTVSDRVPDTARRTLGNELAELLLVEVNLGNAIEDQLARHEHSVRLRRAGLRAHATLAWRGRLAAAAGLDWQGLPSCSVLLVTRRPERLAFALRQVARQSLAPELVVVGHGFQPDGATVEAVMPGAVVLSAPASEQFGAVLARAARAASGDVLAKMDDDDWYGPDFLADLLWARHYAGADLVGSTAAQVYLQRLDRTICRNDSSERVAGFVAGGTMLMSRDLLAEVGGFRAVDRSVDRQLLRAAHAAGAVVYRTQGLGYVLRRTSGGHTWDADDHYFLDPRRLRWQRDGFAPSALLAPDAPDLP